MIPVGKKCKCGDNCPIYPNVVTIKVDGFDFCITTVKEEIVPKDWKYSKTDVFVLNVGDCVVLGFPAPLLGLECPAKYLRRENTVRTPTELEISEIEKSIREWMEKTKQEAKQFSRDLMKLGFKSILPTVLIMTIVITLILLLLEFLFWWSFPF